MKQVGTGRRGSSNVSQQSCLVCSLMARHAKVMMEKHQQHLVQQQEPTVGSGYHAAHSVSTKRFDSSQISLSSSLDGKFNVEEGFASIPSSKLIGTSAVSLTKDNSSSLRPSAAKKRVERSPSMLLMPPPPPRPRSEVMTSPPPHYQIGNNIVIGTSATKNASAPELSYFGSPPNPSQLMHPRLTVMAAITDPSPTTTNLSDPSSLGKSVDSSSGYYSVPKRRSSLGDGNVNSDPAATTTNTVTASASASNADVAATSKEASEQMVLQTTPAWSSSSTIPSSLQHRRQRSVSYDERRSKNSAVSWAPNFITESHSYHPDEFDEHPSDGVKLVENENDCAETPSPRGQQSENVPRPRSASCGGGIMPPHRPVADSSSCSFAATACEPIAEEESVMADGEEAIFEMESWELFRDFFLLLAMNDVFKVFLWGLRHHTSCWRRWLRCHGVLNNAVESCTIAASFAQFCSSAEDCVILRRI